MDIHEYMAWCGEQRFEWGKFDCCTFAAGAMQVTSGVDVMRDIRVYKDETTCAIMLYENFGTLEVSKVFEVLAATIDGKPVDLSEARDGDVVRINWPRASYTKGSVDQRCGLGVFYRNTVYACMHPMGIIKLPVTHRIIDVWRFE